MTLDHRNLGGSSPVLVNDLRDRRGLDRIEIMVGQIKRSSRGGACVRQLECRAGGDLLRDLAADHRPAPKLAMNLMAVMLGRNTYAAALVVTKLERPVTRSAGPLCLRDHEDALRRVLGAGQRILRLGVEPDPPGELAVVDPTSQHELVLVLDVRVDEMKEHPALDAVVGFRRVVGRPVRQSATDQPVRVVAAAG